MIKIAICLPLGQVKLPAPFGGSPVAVTAKDVSELTCARVFRVHGELPVF